MRTQVRRGIVKTFERVSPRVGMAVRLNVFTRRTSRENPTELFRAVARSPVSWPRRGVIKCQCPSQRKLIVAEKTALRPTRRRCFSFNSSTRGTSYFLVKELLNDRTAVETRAISRGTERLIQRAVKLPNKRPRRLIITAKCYSRRSIILADLQMLFNSLRYTSTVLHRAIGLRMCECIIVDGGQRLILHRVV